MIFRESDGEESGSRTVLEKEEKYIRFQGLALLDSWCAFSLVGETRLSFTGFSPSENLSKTLPRIPGGCRKFLSVWVSEPSASKNTSFISNKPKYKITRVARHCLAKWNGAIGASLHLTIFDEGPGIC